MKLGYIAVLPVASAFFAAAGSYAGTEPWMVVPDEVKSAPAWMAQTGHLPVDPREKECSDVPGDLDLFLLVGQSNMAGRGLVTSNGCGLATENVYKLNRDGKWVHASTPVHFDRRSCGVGVAESFVRAYRKDHPERPVGLVPCAVGGSNSATWSPEPPHGIVGVNFHRAVACARKAMRSGRLVGILWHQGESDAKRCAETPEYYPLRLAEIAAAFRRELGVPDVPFLVGEIGGLPAGHSKVMNPVLAKSAAAIPNCRLVPAGDLTGCLPDRVHFDTPSYVVLGTRYHEAWKSLVQGTPLQGSSVHDVLGGRKLSGFTCRGADASAVGRTFSLSEGVLTANASEALVLEEAVRHDCGSFVLFAEIRYESEGFADSGLQILFAQGGRPMRPCIEYQLKTTDIGDAWGLFGCGISRGSVPPRKADGSALNMRIPGTFKPVAKRGVWHKVSIMKIGDRVSFFFDGKPVNSFCVDVSGPWSTGFQTKPYPQGKGKVSFRRVRIHQL